MPEERHARTFNFWQGMHADQERLQADVAESHCVTRGLEWNHLFVCNFYSEYFSQVSREIGSRVATRFDGRELPHVREERSVISGSPHE